MFLKSEIISMSNHLPKSKVSTNAGTNPSKQDDSKNSLESGAGQVKFSRRQAIKRFTSYTAPAMIALISANKASAAS